MNIARTITLDKYDGTFQQTKVLPFHRWYPFTEGFGEKFVCEIIKEFADKSTYLVDPFAGCGTTLLVASKHQLPSGYSEINPFLRFVIETKINSPLKLLRKGLDAPEELLRFTRMTGLLITKTPPAQISPLFADKPYFDEGILDTLLRLKNLIHQHLGFDQDLKNLGLLALANILVDVSNLKRAGDLRYRRPKEKQKVSEETVIEEFGQSIGSIIEDLQQNERPKVETECVGEDALIARPLNKRADVVITSPPYLNGTNYVRNTKLELWLLDFVKDEDEFYNLHHKSLSSGINHVFKGKEILDLPSPIMRAIGELKRVAYDRRIPIMVHQYFSDMKRFFDNLSTYILPSGSLLLDIGDSIFCGIRIPTSEFLKLLAKESGFHFENSLKIRVRRSRGSKDKEVGEYLLWLKKSPQFQAFVPSLFTKTVSSEQNLKELIRQFQDNLPYKAFPYSKRNWGHKYHSLCSYQSKLKPAIAHFLIRWFTKPSDLILDPFGGVGTVSLESKILGRPSVTVDLSPMAYVVAKAKVERVTEQAIEESFNELTKFVNVVKDSPEIQNDIDKYSDFGFNKKLKDYYHPETFKEILAARRWLQAGTDGDMCRISVADAFVIGCLLHILHGNRPYCLSRRSHPVTPFAPRGSFEYRALKERLWAKITRTYDEAISLNETPARALCADSCRLSQSANSNVDVIITSPPFIHSTRFHTNNWIRNWFCGWEPSDFAVLKKNFIEVVQEEDLSIYSRLLEEWGKLLKEGGLIIFHLGTSRDCDMVREVESRIPNCYEVLGKTYEFVRDTETHGVTAQGRTIRHGFLFLRKKQSNNAF